MAVPGCPRQAVPAVRTAAEAWPWAQAPVPRPPLPLVDGVHTAAPRLQGWGRHLGTGGAPRSQGDREAGRPPPHAAGQHRGAQASCLPPSVQGKAAPKQRPGGRLHPPPEPRPPGVCERANVCPCAHRCEAARAALARVAVPVFTGVCICGSVLGAQRSWWSGFLGVCPAPNLWEQDPRRPAL